MQKITDKIKLFIGVSALCLLFSFNLVHALNDYGVSDPNNKLHPQVYAQTNTAGNGGGSTPGNGGGSPGSGTPGDGTGDGYYHDIRVVQSFPPGPPFQDHFTGKTCQETQQIINRGCWQGGPFTSCSPQNNIQRTIRDCW